MHTISEYNTALRENKIENCWRPRINELNSLASSILGQNLAGWVRTGADTTKIGIRRESGSDARMIPHEIDNLGALTEGLASSGEESAMIRAAAFFHLRFEAIHPLRDGNGRVGRIILAIQCEHVSGITREEFLRELHIFENDYKWVFASNHETFHFELLLDLLCRILGIEQDDFPTFTPFSLKPDFPLKNDKGAIYSPKKGKRHGGAFGRHSAA